MLFQKKIVVSLLCLAISTIHAHDILIEGKGAYFLPTNNLFKKIYSGNGIYGAEVTGKLWCNWYGFTSADFFRAEGKSIGLCNRTNIDLVNLAVGLKYLMPFCYGDFYLGLGALPVYLKTQDCSPFVVKKHTKWGCGGIVKAGVYIDLACNIFLDLFVNYSFAKLKFKCCPSACTLLHSAKVDGAWFGAALGYRFN